MSETHVGLLAAFQQSIDAKYDALIHKLNLIVFHSSK